MLRAQVMRNNGTLQRRSQVSVAVEVRHAIKALQDSLSKRTITPAAETELIYYTNRDTG